jgi:hypothetical protein
VLVIEAIDTSNGEAYRQYFIGIMECLRMHLRTLNEDADTSSPVLQYVVLLDLKDLGISSNVSGFFHPARDLPCSHSV